MKPKKKLSFGFIHSSEGGRKENLSHRYRKKYTDIIWEDYLDEAEYLRRVAYNRGKHKKIKKRLNAFWQMQRKIMECAVLSIEYWKKQMHQCLFSAINMKKIGHLTVRV